MTVPGKPNSYNSEPANRAVPSVRNVLMDEKKKKSLDDANLAAKRKKVARNQLPFAPKKALDRKTSEEKVLSGIGSEKENAHEIDADVQPTRTSRIAERRAKSAIQWEVCATKSLRKAIN